MKKLSVLFALSLLLVPAAYAVPTMVMSDGITTITVTDGGAGDMNAVVGAVTYVGGIGNFTVNVNTGITKPVIGSAIAPEMDIAFIQSSTGAGGTLTIQWYDDDFGPLPANLNAFQLDIGGTTDGSVTYNAYIDYTNAIPAAGDENLLASLGPFTNPPIAFSGSALSGAVLTGPDNAPFSLMQEIIITHGAGIVNSSGNANLNAVPEPSALLLLGSGLAALGIFRLRKK